EVRPEPDDGGNLGREDRFKRWITLKHSSKTVLDNYRHAQVRTVFFEEFEHRSGQDAIAERAQTQDGNPSPGGQAGQIIRHRAVARRSLLRFDLRFVDKHHWNVVPDGIDSVALHAFQTASVFLHLDGHLTQRAD